MPQYAGVDLGSNSFHMVLGQTAEDGRVTFVDQAKEYVRIAGGLGPDNALSPESIARALDCLARFGERLAGIDPARVRIVGTNTLRKAKNADDFVAQAEAVIGHRIDIVSGLEEARLIYRGVAASYDRPGRRLVVDIGGGSTEVMVGDSEGPVQLDSLHMGCVSWTLRHFPGGKVDAAGFEEAELAARRQIAGVAVRYRGAFDNAVGSSGTARALDRVLLATGLGTSGITLEALDRLKARLIELGHVSRIDLPEVSRDRAVVLPGGLAILRSVLRSVHVERMTTVDTAMREGILLELVGRDQVGDVREKTVRRMQERFGVDVEHADRVGQTAVKLFDQVQAGWELPDQARHLLVWAARLHEIGLFLRFSGHHKHGAYLLANADLPGFSRQEQRTLAALVLCHRNRFDPERLDRFQAPWISAELTMLLRLAVRLHRSRSPRPRPEIRAKASSGKLKLAFPKGWLKERPLSVADLAEEREHAARMGIRLAFS